MHQSTFKMTLATVLTVSLSACGGGGGSGSSESAISYDGVTSAATLSSTDQANDYVNTYDDFSDTLTESSVSQTRSTTTRSSLKTVHSLNESESGQCGGSIKLSGTYDDVREYIDIDYIADQYCNYDSVIDGTMSMVGTDNDFTLVFNRLHVDYPDANLNALIHGDIDYLEGSASTTARTNIILKDYTQNKSFKLENWVENINTTTYPQELSISGKLYNPTHGYVTVSTLQPIIQGSSHPESGEIKLIGNNSTAYVTFYSASYEVELDADNNASIDDSQVYYYN